MEGDQPRYALCEAVEVLCGAACVICSTHTVFVADKWSPYEIALFESALSLVGKHFSHVAHVIKTKSAAECIEFYYVWKKTAHYTAWKVR